MLGIHNVTDKLDHGIGLQEDFKKTTPSLYRI